MLFILLLIGLSALAKAQEQVPSVEMADGLRSSGKIYVVVLVLALIFAGISWHLFSLERRLKRLENKG